MPTATYLNNSLTKALYGNKDRFVFDIETNGLLDKTTVIHCIVAINVDTLEVHRFRPHEIKEGIELLENASLAVAHNGIKFDHPAVQKITNVCLNKGIFFDTLTAVRLLYSNIKDIDLKLIAKYKRNMQEGRPVIGVQCLPPKLYGSHSLEAWGWRLSEYKGDFGKTCDWETYSEEMLEYCEQDVWVLLKLFKTVLSKIKETSAEFAIAMEHSVSWLLAKQERNGFVFDERKAQLLNSRLISERASIELELINTFNGWYTASEMRIPKRNVNAKFGSRCLSTCVGAPYTPVKWIEFNPNSRQHITKVAQELGWKPDQFTETGQPKIDDEILNKLNIPQLAPISRYLMLSKRLAQLSDGAQAWLSHVHNGKIHGSVNPCGAVTGRATHSFPNIAQVPSCSVEFGPECRELFTVPEGWVLMGSDASGLELRCLANAMYPYDGGAYGQIVLNGDIHWANAQAAGFINPGTLRDHHNPEHEAARNAAKRFIYAFLYGAGDELIGILVGYDESDYLRWKETNAHVKVINSLKRRGIVPTREMICHILKGAEVKSRFLKGLPALKKLINQCKNDAKDQGYVIGLDGRRVHCRSERSSLNAKLQSDGAVVCKAWIVAVDEIAKQRGLKHGWDGDYAYSAWVHDEIQVACRNQEIADLMGSISEEAMKSVSLLFNFKCQLGTDYKTGKSWKDTH
ncbi:DNA polymerase [Aeromonas veronii]|uniref:DNA polymerase n=1 Tax=Aeromonas veronii TaxID=654 RepID=UPI003BA3BA8A